MCVAGRFVDWLGTKKGYAWVIALWSAGAMVHGIVYFADPDAQVGWGAWVLPLSVAGFMICRAILAIGESGNFPAAIKTTAEWFPKKDRPLATGVFNSGANNGAILAPLTVPWIASHLRWEVAFLIVGGTGFLWLVFWLIYYDSPLGMLKKGRIDQAEYNFIHSDKDAAAGGDKPVVKEQVSWFRLLTYRLTWSFTIGKFLTDGVWWFFLFWLPDYLKTAHQLENEQIMLPLADLYSMTMIVMIGGGCVLEYFMKKGLKQ